MMVHLETDHESTMLLDVLIGSEADLLLRMHKMTDFRKQTSSPHVRFRPESDNGRIHCKRV